MHPVVQMDLPYAVALEMLPLVPLSHCSGPFFRSVTAVAGEGAVRLARAVAAVVDAVVACSPGSLMPLPHLKRQCDIAGALRGAVLAARRRIARVAARCRRRTRRADEALAVGRARAGLAAVDAVVAHLAERAVDRLVAAVGRGLAGVVHRFLP